MPTAISRKVLILSLVSLFTDIASEMLYPVLPLYFKSIGFSIAFIGILEGIAEGLAGLSKGYFGQLSDYTGKRIVFIRLGYGLSALSKPMMALFSWPWWLFLTRTADRIGKGLRTGARDAVLAEESTPQTKGAVFGFHRAMDTTGAFIGPALAVVYLWYFPSEYGMLFVFAAIPGVIALFFTFRIKESNTPPNHLKKPGFLSYLKFRKSASTSYRRASSIFILFALFNSSDVFLLLRFKDAGAPDLLLLGVYILYNFMFAAFAYPFGRLADKLGLRTLLILGLFTFAIVYVGFALAHEQWMFIVLFLFYGLYAAATEGLAKAYISKFSSKEKLGTALGSFAALQSVATMIAGGITGWIWYTYNAEIALIISSMGALCAALWLANSKRLLNSEIA